MTELLNHRTRLAAAAMCRAIGPSGARNAKLHPQPLSVRAAPHARYACAARQAEQTGLKALTVRAVKQQTRLAKGVGRTAPACTQKAQSRVDRLLQTPEKLALQRPPSSPSLALRREASPASCGMARCLLAPVSIELGGACISPNVAASEPLVDQKRVGQLYFLMRMDGGVTAECVVSCNVAETLKAAHRGVCGVLQRRGNTESSTSLGSLQSFVLQRA
eukprot:CAMPEP_0179463178 /NCGR_PEP_ID=MMETSP0799-20121207/45316_1 /TAXON_ID=46947 /ORGANISM="Geminigera cryophila, Strain CCMP2564" /LENGTH=218 /DNA_ID=CAMNT_0021266345 /DNA_START=584 /DNA_END=1238 /DNA_ORIENTATION=-